MPFREVAEAIARQANLPVRSIGADDAKEHFGDLAIWVTGGGAASSDWTRATLGWEPREPGPIADIDRPEYLG